MLDQIVIGQTYRNVRTKNLYEVDMLAMCTESLGDLVIYHRQDKPKAIRWVRPIELFKEAFEELVDSPDE